MLKSVKQKRKFLQQEKLLPKTNENHTKLKKKEENFSHKNKTKALIEIGNSFRAHFLLATLCWLWIKKVSFILVTNPNDVQFYLFYYCLLSSSHSQLLSSLVLIHINSQALDVESMYM